jgi:hypothetical protein
MKINLSRVLIRYSTDSNRIPVNFNMRQRYKSIKYLPSAMQVILFAFQNSYMFGGYVYEITLHYIDEISRDYENSMDKFAFCIVNFKHVWL